MEPVSKCGEQMNVKCKGRFANCRYLSFSLPPYVFPLAASYVTVSIPLLRCFYIMFGSRISAPQTEGMHNLSCLLK